MRLPSVISIGLHGLAVLAVFRLPTPAPAMKRPPVEVEIQRPPELKREPEPPKEVEPNRTKDRSAPPPETPDEPDKVEPRKKTDETPPPVDAPVKRDLSKLDLTVKGLPTGGDSAVILPSGPGGGTATPKPAKRYDAGDPLLGKIPEAPEDRFPLKAVKDGYVFKGSRFSAKIALDGRVEFSDKYISFDGKNSGASFDITELAMRAKHQDPNRHEKMRFMEATAALRAKLTDEARRDNLQRSLNQLPERLDEIWLGGGPAPRRRQQLFGLWKDTLDADSDRADGARDARLTIEEYIRRHLPASSADAYTDDELERLSRGLSRPFQPYKR